MQMTHPEAIDLSTILQEILGVPAVWQAIRAGGHEDLVLGAGRRLQGCVADHWRENGCSFDAGRDGMHFPEACEAAQRVSA